MYLWALPFLHLLQQLKQIIDMIPGTQKIFRVPPAQQVLDRSCSTDSLHTGQVTGCHLQDIHKVDHSFRRRTEALLLIL